MKNHTTIRFAKRDEELKEFLLSKGGLTSGLRWLYEYYKEQKDNNIVDEIISALTANGISAHGTRTIIKPKEQVSDNFNHSDNFASIF